jgi:site-specific DNA recombinase
MTNHRRVERGRTKRAAIYCRVSTSEQGENSSLGTQEDLCRQYVAGHGWIVDRVYQEVHTGAELFERPQLTLLREAMRRQEFDVLVVYALDRLSRKQTHQGLVLSEAEYAGVEWDSVTEDIDNSPQGQILRAVIGGMAEMERLKIAERTVRGRIARVQSGKILPGKAALYGYRWRDAGKAAYDIDPDTGPIVRRMFDAVVGGQTIRSVAKQLTQEGVPTPSGNAIWSPSTIHTLIKNRTYLGEGVGWRYGSEKKRGGGLRVVVRPESEQIRLPEGTVPQLIDPSVFEAVQARLRHNRERAARNNSAPQLTLLRGGIARCAYCGTVLSVTTHQGLRYYRHGTRQLDRTQCPSVKIRAERLDEEVWSRISSLLNQPHMIESELERMRQTDPGQADLELLDRQLELISRKQSNLVKRLALLDDDTSALVASELSELARQKRELLDERESVEQRNQEWITVEANLSDLKAYCSRVSSNLENLTYDERRAILDALDVRVKLYNSAHSPRFEITASLPIDDIASITSRASAAFAST